MNLVNWTTNNDIFDVFNHFDYYFDNLISNNCKYKEPYTSISEDEKMYILSIDMPGIEKKDIELIVDGGMINIKAKRKQAKDQPLYSENKDYFYARSFYVPDNVQSDKIKAKSKNGVLSIEIPKLKQLKKDINKIDIT